jgi:hypothetical protein
MQQLMAFNDASCHSVFCLQNDPITLACALGEVSWLAKENPEGEAWLVSATRENAIWTGHILSLRVNDLSRPLKIDGAFPLTGETSQVRDSDLLLWFQNGEIGNGKSVSLGEFVLSRSKESV